MDLDAVMDHNFMSIKDKLNRDHIKLWLPPFLDSNQDKNSEELEKLADAFNEQLSIPKEICLQYLEQLQAKALNNLRERDNYRSTGQASLKIRVPNGQGGNTLTISIELSKTGHDLREEISKATSVTVDRLKMIFKGKFLKDELPLEDQGIKHGLHMMAIILKENSELVIPNYESHIKELHSTKADIELLSKSRYFQVADQSGKLLKLPETESKSLITAMTLHEKGRAALKKEDFAFALVILLEAEKEFCQCNSSLLKSVDNYGVLSLDIVWCYLNLQSVTQLPDAEERLHQCELSFKQSYGTNLERLSALKGFTGNESALFMRLHLLQAIVLYHQNKIDEARLLLNQAEKELKNLEVDDAQLCQLIEIGYGASEARLALRASKGDINAAVSIIENKRIEKKKNEEMEKQERKLSKKRKKLGKCLNGEWIEPELHNTLVSMGYSYEVSKWALAQSNNNIDIGISLIHENSDIPREQSVTTGFQPKMAKPASIEHEDDSDKAVEELLDREGVLSDSESDSDDDDDGGGPSTSQLKKRREEAYSRLREGIANTEDDHLDLNPELEAEFLYKYKMLLAKK